MHLWDKKWDQSEAIYIPYTHNHHISGIKMQAYKQTLLVSLL